MQRFLLTLAALCLSQTNVMAEQVSPQYAQGKETLSRVTGANGAKVVESLKDIAPELGRWIVEFGYGQVISLSLIHI